MRIRVVGARYLPARVTVAMLTEAAYIVGERLGIRRVEIRISPHHTSQVVAKCVVHYPPKVKPVIVLYAKALAASSGGPVKVYADALTHELVHHAQSMRPGSAAWIMDVISDAEAVALERIYGPVAEEAMRP